MRCLFEKSLDGDYPYSCNEQDTQRIDEIFGIETFGKAKDWVSRAVNKSRETNRRRERDRANEFYATRRANQEAMRRDYAEMQQHPERFVNSDFSRNMSKFEKDATNRRNSSTGGVNQWMNDADEGIRDRNDYSDYNTDWEQGDINAFTGNRPAAPAGAGQGQADAASGAGQGQPNAAGGAGQGQPNAADGAGQGQADAAGAGQEQVDPKVQQQIDYIQKKLDGTLSAMKAGKVNGNTVRQQINPLIKRLQDLADSVRPKPTAQPGGAGGVNAQPSTAAQPGGGAGANAQPPSPTAQPGGGTSANAQPSPAAQPARKAGRPATAAAKAPRGRKANDPRAAVQTNYGPDNSSENLDGADSVSESVAGDFGRASFSSSFENLLFRSAAGNR